MADAMTVRVPARDLRVGDVIEMYEHGGQSDWLPIRTIADSYCGGTLYFAGSPSPRRWAGRTCRAGTLVEKRLEGSD